MESSYQLILPGLPNDLALRCLAKISHGYHGSLETVSKRWRDVLRSTEYSSCKAREGWSGDWVFILTDNAKDQWIAYDPDADRWHPIPMIPRKEEYAWSEGYGSVCVGNRFLVIGGSYCSKPGAIPFAFMTNQVFQFDTFTKEWSEAASMRTPRAFFGCCVMSGKVYVCGGMNMSHSGALDSDDDLYDDIALAEVYDPLTNKWEELAPMRNKQMESLTFVHGGKLHVIEQLDIIPPKNTPMWKYRTEIFDPSKQVWRTKQMKWPCSRYGRAEVQVTEDGQMYADVNLEDENVVKRRDDRGEWHVVAQLPSVSPPPDGHSYDKGVNWNGFVALGNELYFVGGLMSYRGAVDLKAAFKLDRCWIWDGKWRETRRMCRPFSGGIVYGFAALKETNLIGVGAKYQESVPKSSENHPELIS